MPFDDEEVDEETAEDIAPSEHIAVAEVDSRRNEGREERQQEVPEPIGRCGESHALCTVSTGEEFTADGPDHGAPRCGESKNKEGGKADHSSARRGSVLWIVAVEREVSDRGEDQEADEHPGGPCDEGLAAAVVLDDVEAVERSAKVDTIQNHLCDEAVVDAGGLEDDRPVVEEVIGAGELLEHLEGDAERNSVTHARSGEHPVPFREHVATGFFGEELGFDLLHFHVDSVVVGWGAVDFQHCLSGLVLFSVTVVPSRCFWEEDDADTEDRGPDETDTFGDSPGCCLTALVLVGAKIDAGCKEDS